MRYRATCLESRGHFIEPTSAVDAVQTLEDLGSPVGAFLRDRCEVKPHREVVIEYLFRFLWVFIAAITLTSGAIGIDSATLSLAQNSNCPIVEVKCT
jgi:hypothetical protein